MKDTECKFTDERAKELKELRDASIRKETLDGFWAKIVWQGGKLLIAILGLISISSVGALFLKSWNSLTSNEVQVLAHKAIEEKITEAKASFQIRPGIICAWPGQLPDKSDSFWDYWRLCDGGASDNEHGLTDKHVNRNTCPGLWPLLRGIYGNANVDVANDVAIKLPDFRDYFLRGAKSDGAAGVQEAAQVSPRDVLWTVGTSPHHLRAMKTTVSETSGATVLAQLSTEKNDVPYMDTRPQNYRVHWIIRIK
jgi:hypothetical protein